MQRLDSAFNQIKSVLDDYSGPCTSASSPQKVEERFCASPLSSKMSRDRSGLNDRILFISELTKIMRVQVRVYLRGLTEQTSHDKINFAEFQINDTRVFV